MERVKLNDNLEFSRLVHGYWRLMDWNLSNEELVKLIEDVYDLGKIR